LSILISNPWVDQTGNIAENKPTRPNHPDDIRFQGAPVFCPGPRAVRFGLRPAAFDDVSSQD
jgi:hypothetical protein